MASNNETTRRSAGRGVDLSWDNAELDKAAKPKRDVKKLFLVIGLGALSWVATYVGMLELIEANMGELPLVHKAIVGFSVAMLMVMVVWLLDQMFSDEIGWFTRLVYTAGYVFLTVISVGFGFGFYWKVLESRGEASRSAESAVGQVQTSLHAAMTRLEQLQGTLDSLTAISTQKSDNERNTGLSCPNSRPGDGPRRKMRDDDAARFKFASEFVKGRVGTVKGDIAALEGDLMKIAKDDKTIVDKAGTRNDFMKTLGRKLDMTVTGFNAFRTDPQLKQIRIDLNERADKVTFTDTKGGTYTCPDTQLTGALKGVVRAIDELPAMEKPKIATVEGSEAVIEAFRRLTATFYGALSFKLPPSPEELRELQKKAVQSVENAPAAQARINAMADQAGLSKRDYVPLAVAIFVDICLLFVSMGRPTNRLQGLVPKMRAAERGPVIQILSRFNEIHRDAEIRENFEMFRHVVFDFHGDYYAAVPLNAPYRPNPANGRQRQGYGVSDAQELLQEAHLLSNLFASFETEKLFTRVHSPLLTTKTIQKRLRRQGSKFANAEAFRIYRFRDGAWSEFILGAVMGAARRVEDEKRRRRVEDDIFRADSPNLDSGEQLTRRTGRPLEERDAEAADAAIERARPGHYPPHAPTHGGYANGQGYPGSGGRTGPYPGQSYPQPMPHAATGTYGAAGWGQAANGSPTGAAYGMPPAGASQPGAANNNTAPPTQQRAFQGAMLPRFMGELPPALDAMPPRAPAENVVLHPALARPAEPKVAEPEAPVIILGPSVPAEVPEKTVTVEAVRETVTYKVPVSEAALPHSLMKAAEAALETEAATAAIEAPRSSLPPPLPAAKSAEAPQVIALTEVVAEQSAKAERAGWDAAHQSGWRPAHDAALNGQANGHSAADDTRTMALRLRPEKREA